MGVLFEQLFDDESSTYTYLLADLDAGIAALVDPVLEQLERDLARIDALRLSLRHTIETHIHADHVTSGNRLAELRGSKPIVQVDSAVTCEAVRVAHGAVFHIGQFVLHALATPGHTPESLSFLVDAPGEPSRVLTGDALLIDSCGRTDFQGGDAGTLWDSVHTQLWPLADELLVFPAHDYHYRSHSTIGKERASNARFTAATKPRTRADFIELMAHLDLPPPKKLAEAVPRNLACGKPLVRQG